MSFRRRFCQVPFVDNLFSKIEFRDVDVVCQNKVVEFKFVKTLSVLHTICAWCCSNTVKNQKWTTHSTQSKKSQIKWMLHNFSALNNEQPNSFGCSLRSLIKMNWTIMGYYYKVQKHLLKAVKIIVTRKTHLRAKLYSASFLSWRDKCLSVGDFPKVLAAGYE